MLILVIQKQQIRSFGFIDMSVGIFDKILKIISIVVTILQVALKSLTGLDTSEESVEE